MRETVNTVIEKKGAIPEGLVETQVGNVIKCQFSYLAKIEVDKINCQSRIISPSSC